jgi:hypothetical protein
VLFSTGVASPAILKDMLGCDGCDAEALTLLMLKYGLAMCWLAADKSGTGRVAKYFIPPLFPEAPKSPMGKEWSNVSTMRTIYFIMSLKESFGNDAVRETELSSVGFLPKGLFDRLLCTALEWCYELQNESHDPVVDCSTKFTLCRSFAILNAGDIWFRMTAVPASHCVKVDVIGDNDGFGFEAVTTELFRRWTVAVSGSLQSLVMAAFVPYLGQGGSQLLLVPVSVLFKVQPYCKEETSSATTVGMVAGSSRYQCFLSYRWGELEKSFVTALHKSLEGGMVRGHTIRVFLDDKVFQEADRFQQVFFDAIFASEVFVPVVSPHALYRMMNHVPEEVDNLLIEWLTALLLSDFPTLCSGGLRKIYPVCCKGTCPESCKDACKEDYFAVKGKLSTAVPVKTIQVLTGLFDSAGIELPPKALKFLEAVTVRDIVNGIMGRLCKTWDISADLPDVISGCGMEIMKIFLRADNVDFSMCGI